MISTAKRPGAIKGPWLVTWLAVGLLFWAAILGGCASGPPSSRQIAGDYGQWMQSLDRWPLSVRCQLVKDTMERCERAGLARDCAWSWAEPEGGPHDLGPMWSLLACLDRIQAEQEEEATP